MHWIETIDSQTAAFAHDVQIAAGSFMTPFLRIVSILGNGGAVFLAAAAVLLLFRQTRKTGTAALIALLAGVILTNLILKNAVARERPFSDPTSVYYTYWMESGSMAASGYSFPSGHTTAAMAFAAVLFLFGRKQFSWTAFFIPVLMGFSRIYFSVHYTTDVLAALIAGLAAALVGALAVKLLAKNKYVNRFFEADGIAEFIRSGRTPHE